MSDSVDHREDGGSPLLGEPLAIEFVNTHYAVRGRPREGIGTPGHLAGWLAANAAALGIDPVGPQRPTGADVAAFRDLRDAIRAIAGAIVDQRLPDPARVETLNAAVRAASRWPTLVVSDGALTVTERVDGTPTRAALAAIARNAVSIFGGPLRADLRACHAPGCVLFFVKDHPRRAWCSGTCGNRARAARHYQRHREDAARAWPAKTWPAKGAATPPGG